MAPWILQDIILKKHIKLRQALSSNPPQKEYKNHLALSSLGKFLTLRQGCLPEMQPKHKILTLRVMLKIRPKNATKNAETTDFSCVII